MCLTIHGFWNRFLKTIKTDMTVYKTLRVHEHNPELYATSVYQQHTYVLGEKGSSDIKVQYRKGLIDHGYHTFVNVSDAVCDAEKQQSDFHIKRIKRIMGWTDGQYDWMFQYEYPKLKKIWNEHKQVEFKVYECVIPAGSKIYHGFWESKLPNKRIMNIVSNMLIVNGLWVPKLLQETEEDVQDDDDDTVYVLENDSPESIVEQALAQAKAVETVKSNVTNS